MDLDEYISKLKSSSATPGGGSASAISSMFAASLNSMASLLSVGKKKLAPYENDFINISRQSDQIIEELKKLSNEDEESFQGIMDALHMDKTDKNRVMAMRLAIESSIKVSWSISLVSVYNMENALFLCEHGNRNLITDSISAAYMAYTAIHTSTNNIRINLKFQKLDDFKIEELLKLKLFMENVESIMEKIKTVEISVIH
jgi:formiminotetrahydrofolate cyclodeaminase